MWASPTLGGDPLKPPPNCTVVKGTIIWGGNPPNPPRCVRCGLLEDSYSHILVLISCTLTILSVFPMVFIAINHYIDDTYQLINIAA